MRNSGSRSTLKNRWLEGNNRLVWCSVKKRVCPAIVLVIGLFIDVQFGVLFTVVRVTSIWDMLT
jgi:hypothetical protein